MSGALNDHPVAPYLASKETRLRLKLPWRHEVFDGAYPELVLAAKRFTGASPKGHRRSLREMRASWPRWVSSTSAAPYSASCIKSMLSGS